MTKTPAPPPAPGPIPAPGGIPMQVTPGAPQDLVCGKGEGQSGGLPFKTEYKGNTYSFCSEACKQKFDQDPEHYLQLSRDAAEVPLRYRMKLLDKMVAQKRRVQRGPTAKMRENVAQAMTPQAPQIAPQGPQTAAQEPQTPHPAPVPGPGPAPAMAMAKTPPPVPVPGSTAVPGSLPGQPAPSAPLDPVCGKNHGPGPGGRPAF